MQVNFRSFLRGFGCFFCFQVLVPASIRVMFESFMIGRTERSSMRISNRAQVRD